MSTPSHPITVSSIAIIDHRSIFRIGLKTVLQRLEPAATITDASDCSEWLDQPTAQPLDVLFFAASHLTDAELQTQLTRLKAQHGSCKIALYDYRQSWESLVGFFRIKVSGYLREDFTPQELEECLNYLKTNRLFLGPDIVAHLIYANNRQAAKPAKLSKMEGEVAQYLIQGMNVSKIAQVMQRKTSTISTVKSNIQKKLHVDNIIDLAKALK